MEYLIAALIMTTVTLVVFVAAILVPARGRAIQRRLSEIDAERDRYTPRRRRRHQERREQLEALAGALGDKIAVTRKSDAGALRVALLQAGFRGVGAVTMFQLSRIVLAVGLVFAITAIGALVGVPAAGTVLLAGTAAMVGWLLPRLVVAQRRRRRAREVQLALPDMLDMMVVCVEAGLGLNQAMERVAGEMSSLSRVLSEELQLVNLEIQTGTARSEALRNLGDRTDCPDLRSLTAMLVQTDRFGTSIARALRVHSQALRTKRRQRAEEQAAKTTIKLVFPLVLFIFPAMLVVILAPAVLHIINTMGGLT